MRKQHRGQRPNSRKELNPPKRRRRNSQVYHTSSADDAEREHLPKFLQDLANLLGKGYIHDLFCSGAPFYVYAEEMTQDSLADMEGDAAEEDCEQDDPFEVAD